MNRGVTRRPHLPLAGISAVLTPIGVFERAYPAAKCGRGHDFSPVRPSILAPGGQVALANSSERVGLVGLANELSADGWVKISPFGEFPKMVQFRTEGGGVQDRTFIQQLDYEGAVGLANRFNSFIGRAKRAFKSVPLFIEHGDLAEVQPEQVSAASVAKRYGGSIDRLEARADGLYARVGLFPDGEVAVANDGKKYISVFWWANPVEQRDRATVVRPYEIISGALTDSPNIPGTQALANNAAATAATAAVPNTSSMKPQILGLLAAQGIALANDASEQTVLEKLTERITRLGADNVALANEKTALTGRVTGLETEKGALTTDLNKARTDLALVNTALANAKTARAEALVDLAIAQGKKTVAERAAEIAKLTGAADDTAFNAAATALANSAVVAKTTSSAQDGQRSAADTGRSPRDQIFALANSDARYKGIPWEDAYPQILRDHPALAEALKQKPTA